MRPTVRRSTSCAALTLLALAGCGTPISPFAQRQAASTMAIRGEDGPWQAYPDAPVARCNAGAVAIGINLFVVGGTDESGNRLNTVSDFTAFSSWSGVQNLPTARSSMAVTDVPANRVLVAGGINAGQPLNTVEMYGTDQKAWSTMAPMPTARWGAGAASDGVFAYVAGGAANGQALGNVERFDVRSNSWTKIANLGVAREGCVAARLGRRLVVIGGRNASGYTNAMEIYDLDNGGAWKVAKPMPTARAYPAVAVYGAHVFVLGGMTSAGATDAVESYSLVDDTWTRRAPLPMPICGAVAAKLGERLVVSGGRANGQLSTKTWGRTFPF